MGKVSKSKSKVKTGGTPTGTPGKTPTETTTGTPGRTPTETPGGTGDEMSPFFVFASTLDGEQDEICVGVQRLEPTHYREFIDIFRTSREDFDALPNRIREVAGGGLYLFQLKRRNPQGKLVWTNEFAKLRLSGEPMAYKYKPKKRASSPAREDVELQMAPPAPTYGAAPVYASPPVMQPSMDLADKLIPWVMDLVAQQKNAGEPLDVVRLIGELRSTLAPQASDPSAQMFQHMEMFMQMREMFDRMDRKTSRRVRRDADDGDDDEDAEEPRKKSGGSTGELVIQSLLNALISNQLGGNRNAAQHHGMPNPGPAAGSTGIPPQPKQPGKWVYDPERGWYRRNTKWRRIEMEPREARPGVRDVGDGDDDPWFEEVEEENENENDDQSGDRADEEDEDDEDAFEPTVETVLEDFASLSADARNELVTRLAAQLTGAEPSAIAAVIGQATQKVSGAPPSSTAAWGKFELDLPSTDERGRPSGAPVSGTS